MSRRSNAETAQENYDVFDLWRKGKSLEQLIPYLSRRKNGDVIEHKLNRSRINNELRIGSAINSHPKIRKELADLDNQLLSVGLRDPDMPVFTELVGPEGGAPLAAKPVDDGGLSASEKQRLNYLEEENAYLREELKQKNDALKRFGLINRFLTDTMRFPR